jgi:sugar/nucleoside kinase (ribokinase family)
MKRFLVIGSVAWDEIVELDAPLRAGSHNGGHWRGGRIGGGAANTAMALARAGSDVQVISAVGEDAAGRALIDELTALGVDTTLIDRRAPETTRSLVMLDARGERTVVNLARAPLPLPSRFADREAAADWLYVRSADPALTPLLAQRVAHGGRVLAHLPPLRDGFRPAQVLVASASDLDQAFLDAPFAAGRRVAGTSLEWMVVTYGADGARAFGAKAVLEQVAPRVAVVDSTGAGDVFAGGLLHAMADGKGMADALATAVDWGATSVRYAGTVPPPRFPRIS